MNNKIFQALSILMLAIGVGTITLAHEAQASSEDVLRASQQDNSREQIEKAIILGPKRGSCGRGKC